MAEMIRVMYEGGLVEISLNRPDELNSINRQMIAELHEALHEAADKEALLTELRERVRGIAGGNVGPELMDSIRTQAERFGAELVTDDVVSVDLTGETKIVRTHDAEYAARAVIIATGSHYRKLGVPGEERLSGHGVSWCATCDGFFFRDKTVVIVGGGDTAAEEALYLSRLASKVYLVFRGKELRAVKMLQDRLMGESRIKVIWNSSITEIKGNGKVVTAVSLENAETGETKELSTDGVFIFIGYSPNNQLIPPAVLMNEQGYVLTDEKCETSVPGIFAAGDLRQKFANQIVVAAADGCIAALGAAQYVEMQKAGVRSLR